MSLASPYMFLVRLFLIILQTLYCSFATDLSCLSFCAPFPRVGYGTTSLTPGEDFADEGEPPSTTTPADRQPTDSSVRAENSTAHVKCHPGFTTVNSTNVREYVSSCKPVNGGSFLLWHPPPEPCLGELLQCTVCVHA